MNASFPRIVSYYGEVDGSIPLPDTYDGFTQPASASFPTKVSSGTAMFLDVLADGSQTADGIEVYVNLLQESMLINITV